MPAIPMEVALPLALHLRSPVTYNFLTGESWKPGEKYQEGRSISQLAFIEQESERFKATLLFASILRSIYNHPDWSELHAFFTKRYSKSQTLSNRDARKLTAPADAIHNAGKTVVVDFNTDPSSVGLPRDLPAQLAAACRAARSTLVGPDPQPCSIGPAISVAMGGGAYMDLMYMGQPPGKYPERTLIAGQWYGWEGGKHGVVAGAIATTKKGGRGRSWGEWADLWRAIADWVYEHDATSLELHFLSVHSYKYRLSDQERRNMGFGLRVPRQYLSTDAISAADAIRDVFDQLEAEPTQFQGIEWDYLEFEFEREEQEAFRARFGRKDPDHKKTLEALVRPASLSRWDQVDYEDVSPVALKPCPDSFRGADWEAWLLSIEGGDVVVVKTPFQALWAVMLLSQFPLVIKIVNKEDKFPRYRDPAVASSSSSTPDRPTRAILSATFRKTYASFQDRTAVAQKQATPLTRARWAVVDEPKFRALISELKAINDSLTSLLPAVSNKTRVRMRAEIMQSNDANQLQNLVNAADDVADLISETASLRLEMLSTTGEGVPRRLQPRLVHVSDPAAAPQPTAETPQPAVIPSPAAVPTSRSQSPLPVASPPPTGPPEPRIDAYDDTGALVIHKVYSKPDSLSCYAWVSGQWEVPDLSEIQPVFHPAFNLVFIPDSILGVAENVLEVDVAADPRYAGWSPGSTSLTGFAREMTFWRQAVKEVEQSQKGWLRATNTPALTSNFVLQRWNSTVKNGLGEDWTEKKGHDQLRELLGPSDYTWLDPEEGFKMRHQISDLLADMRMSPVPSLESTGSIGCLANSDPNRGGGNFGMIDFLFQMVKAREVTLRIARSQSKWHGGITARIVYDLVAAELWSTKLEYREDTDAFQVTRHAKEEQIDGIVKFAKEMKWPYVDEIHDTAAKLRDPDTENTAGIDMCVWDWINGLFLPGAFFQSSLIGVLSALSPTLRNCLPRATIQPRKGNYGIVYPQASYWCVRSVVGKVMAPMSTAIAGADGINTNNANVSPIRCIGGWVGPCPSPSLPESTFGLLVQLQARPPTFTTGDPADLDALETRNIPAFVTESKRAGLATAAWIEPTPPPGPADTVTLQTLRLSKLPGAPVGGVRAPEYRARLDFRLVRSRTMETITLHANSVFVAAPACRGGGSAHRVDPCRAAAYTFRVLALEDLPRSEPGTARAAGATTTVINAAGGGVAETFARAWCSQKGVDAVVWQRDGGRSCFKCALMVAGEEGLGVKVLIMV